MTTASRLRALDDPQCRRDEFGVALEGAFGAQFHAALLQRALDARQAVAAEGIILVEDRDIGEVKILGQMLDPGLGLGAVAGADIDDVAKLGGAQEFGAGKWADERHVSARSKSEPSQSRSACRRRRSAQRSCPPRSASWSGRPSDRDRNRHRG